MDENALSTLQCACGRMTQVASEHTSQRKCTYGLLDHMYGFAEEQKTKTKVYQRSEVLNPTHACNPF